MFCALRILKEYHAFEISNIAVQLYRLRMSTTVRRWARCAMLTVPKTSSTNPRLMKSPTLDSYENYGQRSLGWKRCSRREIRSECEFDNYLPWKIWISLIFEEVCIIDSVIFLFFNVKLLCSSLYCVKLYKWRWLDLAVIFCVIFR